MRRIFGTGEARNFKFGVQIDLGKSHFTSDKIPHKGLCQGQEAILILNPFRKSGMGEARNVEFGTRVD